MMPGDPIQNIFGEDYTRLKPEFINELKAKYGLDQPLTNQYFNYLTSLTTLDFGYSVHFDLRVTDLIAKRLFWTALLVIPSILIGGLLALVLGTVVGFKKDGKLDKLLTGSSIFFYTLPSFLIAMLAITVFGFHLGWFPLGHLASGSTTGLLYYFDVGWHLFLPIAVLVIIEVTSKFMVVRNLVTQIIGEDFITTARAKGLNDREIALKHVMKNVYPSFISMIALDLGFLVAGATLIEIVFSINGMGSLLYEAILARDYPVIQGVFIIMTLFVLVSNFIADLLYGVVDPRIGDAKDAGVNL
jgi:peptide/nickel transport system permease protein